MLNIVIIALLVLSFLWGWSKGVVRQIGSLAGFVLAIAACYAMGDSMTAFVGRLTGSEGTPSMLDVVMGHALLFVVVWLGVSLVARALKSMIKAVHLGVIDSLFGALFMMVKTALVMSIFLNLWMAVAPAEDKARCSEGLTGVVLNFGPALMDATHDMATAHDAPATTDCE